MNEPLAASHNFVWLDLLRGLAALEVLLAHARTLFFENIALGSPSLMKRIFYYATGFSHQAVMIFFVLSGFLISRNIHFNANRFRVKDYAIDRLVRLWIVVIPALILTWIADRVSLTHFPLHANEWISAKSTGLLPFTGNLFFLQTILVPTFGSNTPLWSLSNECWYYIMFPLLYFAVIGKKMNVRLALLISVCAIGTFVGNDILMYLLIWSLGFLIVLLRERFGPLSGRNLRLLLLPLLLLWIWMINYTRTGGAIGFGYDLATGALTAALVYCGISSEVKNLFLTKIAGFFSSISFTLYAFHMPLLVLCGGWLGMNRSRVTMPAFILYLSALLAIIGFSTLCWYFFESRYRGVRSMIKTGKYFNH